jgi:hypothetical protein
MRRVLINFTNKQEEIMDKGLSLRRNEAKRNDGERRDLGE